MVTVIEPVVGRTFKLYSVEYIVLADATSIVTVGVPVKMKLPPVVDRREVDDAKVIVTVATVLKITLWPGVVMELPEAEIRLVPVNAPVIVSAVLADVIVEETMERVKADSVDMKTMLSAAVAVIAVDESSVIPMLVALD